MNNVPFFDLKRQYESLQSEVEPVIAEIFKSQWFIKGPHMASFEKNMAAYIGVKHALAVKSGTEALYLALKVMGVGPGDEVITPAYSFFASTGAILLNHATPVFVDVDPKTCNIDTNKIEAAITDKTKVIMPVHLFGQCASMGPILTLAKKHNLKVLEDFAQSLGATSNDHQAGGMGDMGATSFYPTKNLGGAGEGGLITTNNDELADKVILARDHGMRERYLHESLGTDARLDSIQCAYLDIKLKSLDSYVKKRTENAEFYLKALNKHELKNEIQLPYIQQGMKSVWNQFCVQLENRDEVRQELTNHGIGTDIYYPYTIPQQKVLRGICDETGWPVSEAIATKTLALPIFPELTTDERQRVVEVLKETL